MEERSFDSSCLEALPVPPKSDLEILLAEIWNEVLGLEDVGVEDSFFDLGGDSILSIRIVAKARNRDVPLTSRLLFEAPTIAQLARKLAPAWEETRSAQAASAQPQEPIKLSWSREPSPLDGTQVPSPADFPEAELSPEDLSLVIQRVVARAGLDPLGATSPGERRAAGF
ncbi:MAG: hypothetical protein KDD47_10130 [Acidobacteria bacterium]|nr:hypothetical protein [Acidobacteriota bacterium]